MKILPAAEMKRLMKDPLIKAIVDARVDYVGRMMDQWERMFGKPEIELKKEQPHAADGTMTVLQAFNKCRDDKQIIMVESTPFALLGWKSPESGETKGPYMTTVWLGVAVEIGENGRFKDMFPGNADGYFPWVEEKKS